MAFKFRFLRQKAEEWGVEYGSDEYKAKLAEWRAEAGTKATIAPCGPACPKCGDNSYTCGCK